MFFNNQDIANTDATEKAVLYSHFCFSWELSEIGAVKPDGARLLREAPAAFGLLCVETVTIGAGFEILQPAAFGLLCVETCGNVMLPACNFASRLRAAVC